MRALVLIAGLAMALPTTAQMIRPPAFIGGVPGLAQMRALDMQRHQARTLLYREAIEELRKNPAAADVPECPLGNVPSGPLCLKRPEPELAVATSTPKTVAAEAPTVVPPLPTDATKVVAATTRADVPDAAGTPKQAPVVLPPGRRRLAVLVGNNDYKAPIPGLDTPVADVEKIGSVLRTRFGYDVKIVRNASKTQIIEAVNAVAGDATQEDSVLLFYAGHGYLMDDTKMGYWIPVDASVKTAANWISNTDISKLLTAIRARQLILVSDSCFSGSLTREQKVSASGASKADEILRRRSVLVFTSGGEEPVSDEGKEGHSIFAWSLIKTLDATTGTTPGHDVWKTVHGRVTKEYPQEPQYGAVVSAGHVEGGEFLFQPR